LYSAGLPKNLGLQSSYPIPPSEIPQVVEVVAIASLEMTMAQAQRTTATPQAVEKFAAVAGS
jgi:hypothetical protein